MDRIRAGSRVAKAFGATTGVAVVLLGGATAARGSITHVVIEGETLSSIGAASGVSGETVAAWSGIDPAAPLSVGQSVVVPSAEEAGVGATGSATASTGAGHTVVAGESLSSVAAANGVTVADLAATNGISADAMLIEGQALTIPAVPSAPPPGMGSIPSPSGDLYLDPAAADSWNAMRDDSIANYGVDLYPAGPSSAYRTTAQQQELYDLYLSGQGAPANPPGTSSHELGVAVDVADPAMRDVVDLIGAAYGWSGTIPSEWWHVAYGY